jgi:hypothetical protein
MARRTQFNLLGAELRKGEDIGFMFLDATNRD